MGEKEKILAKLNMKDYKNELELILEQKQFDEEAKSLLLSIFYKFDNFYKDYMTVKKDVEDKTKFFEDYISIIKTKCKKIHMIKPQEIKGKMKYEVNRSNGEIRCIPNELILLYAVYDLAEKNLSEDKFLLGDFTPVCVNNIINKGKIINETEIIRDFNGWSWNIQIDNSDNIVYNLIFQNALIILGYQFIRDNINKAKIMDNFKFQCNLEGYGESGNAFLNELYKNCVLLYNNLSLENHNKCLKYKKNIINKKNMLNNRKEYLEDKNKASSSISKQIKKIDDMLENIELLRIEYEKCIKKNKNDYFCISDFVESKENERKKLLKSIKENNKVLSQKKYLSEHDDYEDTIDLYDQIKDGQDSLNYQTGLLNLQKQFLKCFKIKIDNCVQKREVFNCFIQLRYYCNLFYKKEKAIISCDKLANDLKSVIDKLTNKMLELKLIDLGFKSGQLNSQIIEFVLSTKIIELEAINLKISFIQNDKIEVECYDSKILETKKVFDIPSDEEINSKKDRKVKLLKIGG